MDNDLRKRDSRNAPGPFYAVEKLCLACGLPENEAPDLLADLVETNGDTFFVKQPITPEEVERACSALDACCVKALRYAGDDPAIIHRLQEWSADCCDATDDQVDASAAGRSDERWLRATRVARIFSRIRNWLGGGPDR